MLNRSKNDLEGRTTILLQVGEAGTRFTLPHETTKKKTENIKQWSWEYWTTGTKGHLL